MVPSIWPEPFGQVGPEAGLYGVPAAAFAVGGTPSWLTDGVNGRLAPGDPPGRRVWPSRSWVAWPTRPSISISG